MKSVQRILLRILPVIVIIIVAVILLVNIYNDMISDETDDCWSRLNESTVNMSDKITASFSDNLNLLERVADAVVMQEKSSTQVLDYIRTVREKTAIFSRIDILLPEQQLIMEDGTKRNVSDQLPFEEIAKKGTHITTRYIDHHDGRSVVYFATPIIAENEVRAMLIAVIRCENLKNVFPANVYDSNAQMYLVDRRDGSFIINNTVFDISTVEEMRDRELLDGYKNKNYVEEIKAGLNGNVAFTSKLNGKNTYMSYVSVKDTSYTLCLAVQDEVIFKNVNDMQSRLITSGIIISIMVFIYLLWNIVLIIGSVRNAQRAEAAEIEQIRNNARARFLSTMSHDLKTPLNGIIGMLNVIDASGGDFEKTRDCLAKIRTSANYLSNLANDVLDINEIESGKIVLTSEPINLKELMNNIEVLVSQRAKDVGISFSMDLSGIEHERVIGSGSHLQRILINLTGNAIKYNKKNGSVSLKVEEIREEEKQGIYRFTVSDTGIGMSEKFQKTMFKAFEQENSGARTTHSGHGLGLTIVQSLTLRMNGEIDVKSKEGEGTTFVITLPLAYNLEQAKEAPEKSEAVKPLKGVKILLAEDNELNMEIAKIMLKDAGAEITPVVNGREAYDTFLSQAPGSFDIILMDIMMPEMDGLEATRAIRKQTWQGGGTIPIIAMTANTFAEDIERSKNAGMNEHIGKPLDMDLLISKILEYK